MHVAALTGLGHCAITKCQFHVAKKCFQAVLVNNPDFVPAYLGLAECALQQYNQTDEGKYKLEDALVFYNIVLFYDCNNYNAYIGLGRCAGLQNDWIQAEKCYEEAQEIQPEWGLAYFGLGQCARVQKKYQTAKSFFKKAVEKNPFLLQAKDALSEIRKHTESITQLPDFLPLPSLSPNEIRTYPK